MVEQVILDWQRAGGKGIPVVLLPEDWDDPEVFASNRLFSYTSVVSKPLVTNLDAACGILYGSLLIGDDDASE